MQKSSSHTWWSFEVVNLFFVLHLENVKTFVSDNQNVVWLPGKAEIAEGKFDTDQKKWEAEISQKKKAWRRGG